MEETTVTDYTAPVPEPAHGLILSNEAQYFLSEGAGWAKFLGIVGFILSAIIVIAGCFAGSLFSYLSRISPNPNAAAFPAGLGIFLGIFYGLIGLLYFFPSYYIYQFGNNAKKAILFQESPYLTTAISRIKSFLKFWGIITIIYVAFCVLGVVAFGIGLSSLSHLR